MKTTKIKCLLSAISLFSTLLSSSVFAANPYGIEYSGGEELSANNVQINPNLVKELTPLVAGGGISVEFSNSSHWLRNYTNSSVGCIPVNYLRIWKNNQIGPEDNIYFTISKDQYTMKVQIENVVLENVNNISEDGQGIMVGVFDGGSLQQIGPIYSDSACQNLVDNVRGIRYQDNEEIFYQTRITLYGNDKTTPFSSNQLYFGITDIDAAQSFKILNTGNLLNKNNMYALSAEDLQPSDPSIADKNMYVTNGNYIYSQGRFNTPDNSNIYVKISPNTQKEGLEMVFGFKVWAGSGIQYYAKQYQITYLSDENGKITGITDEKIISGQNPTGSTETSNEGYELVNWTADKDVTLADGTVIKAGQPITPTQITQVVVNEDLVFTAIHAVLVPEPPEPGIAVPNAGESTEEFNGTLVSLSIITVALGSLIVASLPRLFHKKVNFKK